MALKKVTLEQAQGLREIGFPQNYDEYFTYTNLDGGIWVKPSLADVQKWFWDRYEIFIKVDTLNDDFGCFYYEVSKRYMGTSEKIVLESSYEEMNDTHYGDSQEYTLSEAITKAIEVVQNNRHL